MGTKNSRSVICVWVFQEHYSKRNPRRSALDHWLFMRESEPTQNNEPRRNNTNNFDENRIRELDLLCLPDILFRSSTSLSIPMYPTYFSQFTRKVE